MQKRKRILIVDDEKLNRDVLSAMLRSAGHDIEIASDGPEALTMLKPDIDLVLLDVSMPGMDGFEVCRRIRQDLETGDVPIIMVTALSSKQDRLQAVEAGANDYVTKPVDWAELRIRSASLLKVKEAQDFMKQYQKGLEEAVEQRTSALRQALDEMAEAQQKTYEAQLDTIHRLALAAEYKDHGTAAHLRRMGMYCGLLARRLGLPSYEVDIVRNASPMHDVGKIGIPDGILLKRGRLEPWEWDIMKQHPVIGGRILDNSPSELLQAGKVIALSHHERWDGTGYPLGTRGEDIPIYGRICAVVDMFDALVSERPYKDGYSVKDALDIMYQGRDSHFDPRVLDMFLSNVPDMVSIYEDSKQKAESEEVS